MLSTRWTTVAKSVIPTCPRRTILRRASWDELTWRIKLADWVHYPQSAAVRYSIALIQTMECLNVSIGHTVLSSDQYTNFRRVRFSAMCYSRYIKCTRPSFVSRLSCLARCGRWNFLQDTGEVHLIYRRSSLFVYTVIPRLTKIIRSGITFVSRNVISRRFL